MFSQTRRIPLCLLCVIACAPIVLTTPMMAAGTGVKGALEEVDPSGVVSGWAQDLSSPSLSIQVHLYVDGTAGGGGTFAAAVSANAPRTEPIAGAHGFRYSIPSKYRDGVTKHLLRSAMRGVVPEETRTLVKKTGWNAPAHLWFSGRGDEQLQDLIHSRSFVERGIYRTLEQPGLGPISMEDGPFRSSGVPAVCMKPAPLQGQHTREICARVLVMAADEIDSLVTAGVLEEPAADEQARVEGVR